MRVLFLWMALTISTAVFAQSDRGVFVANKLKSLSLEDKVGEMTQFTIDMIMEGQPYNLTEPPTLNMDKMRKVLVELKTGSILNAGGHAYTREQWETFITAIQKMAMEEKPSGIPVLYGIDAIHGVNYTMGGTLFPQPLGQASTWNLDLARQCGEVTAYETRASGIPWSFSPMLDVGRDARWSRLWEGYGEDVLMCSEMGTAFVKGLQGNDISSNNNVAACLKHFLGYSQTITGKDRSQAWIPERQLREIFVPPFQKAIDEGAQTVMICSGEINGIPVHADKWVLTNLLRDEMGFKGLAVTDWEDIGYLVSRHRVATDFKDAIRIAINAGIDLAMVPTDLSFPTLLKQLVEEGKVPMSRIDESVTRILNLKYDLGLFKQAYYPFDSYPKFGSQEFKDIALNTARESIILLENNGVLPIKETSKVMIVGPTANSIRALNGGWTGTWQGDKIEYNTPNANTITTALQKLLGAKNVDLIEGADFDSTNIDIKSAALKAGTADAIIVCIGENSYTEKPGDIDDMNLPPSQIELVQQMKKSGKPVIVVVVEGRPRIIRPIVDVADAILLAFLPGDFGGEAIGEIIIGKTNPSGKLPVTYPKHPNDLVTYDHKGTDLAYRDFSMNGFKPQWEFGHGLSYTTFDYTELAVLTEGDNINISVRVRNTGKRKGKEAVPVFITDKVASITPSVKRLRAFDKVELEPGASTTLKFSLSKKDLAFIGQDMKWVTEPGEFEVSIGNLKQGFSLK